MRTFFLARALREKFLLLVFAGLAAALWFSSVSGRARVFLDGWRHTSSELTFQSTLLQNRGEIEARAARAVKDLDPGKTISGLRLPGELDTMARSAGLMNTSIDSSRSEQANQFTFNTVQFAVRKADLGSLQRFCEAIGQRAPYIGLEKCAIQADAANPAQLNATLAVFSVEITH